MIIGISGKINSGKDTIGEIIRGLVSDNITDGEIIDYQLTGAIEPKTDWKIKKFADKLKDIVCLLVGCTREQLEDREFKETELGKEWEVWYHQDYDPDNFELTVHSTEDKAWLHSSVTIAYQPKVYSKILTPRLLLQLLGTNCGRDIIHPNIWINVLMSEFKVTDPENGVSMGSTIDYSNCKFPNWIITDMRFPNEMKAIEDRSGITIRINRPFKYKETIEEENFKIKNEHPSETSLDKAKFDYVINNNGTIEDLIEKVKQILIKEKIL